MDRDTIDLIKQTVAKDATDEELSMFIHQCEKLDLDPLAKEIYFIKYTDKKKGGFTVSIQVGIDGFLKIAQRHEDFDGIIAFAVCQNDIFEIDAQNYKITHKFGIKNRGGIIGAWAQLNRKGKLPFIKYVSMEEFYKEESSFWQNYPTDMIEKTAKKKVIKNGYGVSGVNSDDEEQTSKILLPESKIEEKPLLSANNFGKIVNELLPEKTENPFQRIKDVTERIEITKKGKIKKKKKTSKKKVIARQKQGKQIINKDEIFKYKDHEGHRYYYEYEDRCMECNEIKLVNSGSLTCWDCDQKESKITDENVLDSIKNPINIEEPKPKVEKPIFSFMKKKKDDIIEAEVQKDLEQIPPTLNFSLEFKDSLDPETLKFKGDDWYNSSTAKSKVKKDFPLFTFRVVVKQNFPEHADAIEELFKEQLADKTRAESLLFVYYNALRDYLEVVIKENDRGIDLIYSQRMNRMINKLIELNLTGTIEEIHAKIKDATEWNDDWVKWAIKFLKLRGHL